MALRHQSLKHGKTPVTNLGHTDVADNDSSEYSVTYAENSRYAVMAWGTVLWACSLFSCGLVTLSLGPLTQSPVLLSGGPLLWVSGSVLWPSF